MLIELFTVLTAPVLVLFNDLLSAVGARQIQYFVVVEDHLDESADLIEASRGFSSSASLKLSGRSVTITPLVPFVVPETPLEMLPIAE